MNLEEKKSLEPRTSQPNASEVVWNQEKYEAEANARGLLREQQVRTGFLRHGIDIQHLSTMSLDDVVPKLLFDSFQQPGDPEFLYFAADDLLMRLARERGKDFAATYCKLIDFDHKENFHRTVDLMYNIDEMFWKLQNEFADSVLSAIPTEDAKRHYPQHHQSFQDTVFSVIQPLREAVEQRKGNYVLNKMARRRVEKMERWKEREITGEPLSEYEEPPSESSNDEIFLLSKDMYACIRDGALFTAPSQQAARIKELRSKRDDLRNKLAQVYYVSSANVDVEEVLKEVRRIDAEIDNFFSHQLTARDLVIIGTQLDPQGEDRLMSDYWFFVSEEMRAELTKDFGLPLSDLNLKEQYRFLSFLQTTQLSDSDHLKEFTELFGVNGMRTFLATALDESVGPQILEFAREAGVGKSQEVFDGFAKYADKIDALEVYLLETFGLNDSAAVTALTEKMLTRGCDLLKRAHEFRHDPEQLTALLRGIDADTQSFVDACRLLHGRGELTLEDIKGASLETISGDAVSKEDTEVILKIQADRYRGKYPETLEQELIQNLSDALKSPFSRFYLYRNNGEIISYVRFDALVASNDNDRKYMASFMTNPKFDGGALGQALLEVALQKELEKGAIYAECDPSLVSFYEKFGFRLLRLYKDAHGVDTCDIVLDPASESESLREAA